MNSSMMEIEWYDDFHFRIVETEYCVCKAVSYCMKNDVGVWRNTNMAIKVG